MVNQDFQGLKLSTLGFGAMRLPVLDGNDAHIDEAATEQMIAYAMEQGVNYYDTAWGYHSGNSELVLGKILRRYPRESFYLASKFPGYDLSNMDKVESIFEKQLEKCQVDFFDFYLFHNVCEMNIDAYLDSKFGIFPYLMEQKAQGRIRHLGFSVHGSYDVMKRFLDAYGEHMEFCQVQLNWMDWAFQNAKAKVELLRECSIPIWVMEPLRGGQLASLSEEATAKLRALRPDESIPGWSFRYLQTFSDIKVVLSGMSNMEQLQQNIRIFETEQPLHQEEIDALMEIAAQMTRKIALPCTSCRYCVEHCPERLDIPALLRLYNEHCSTDGGFIAPMAISSMPESKRPGACVACRCCEAVCPQNIQIAEAMMDFHAKLNA